MNEPKNNIIKNIINKRKGEREKNIESFHQVQLYKNCKKIIINDLHTYIQLLDNK